MTSVRLQYRLLNVFTLDGERLSGNPLCVFEDGSSLSVDRMQALALQFNLSETTFILPSATATAAVRIFTPAMELPFAGHPTLGTAHVVRDLHRADHAVSLAMQAGDILVRTSGKVWTLEAPKPKSRDFAPAAIQALLSALGLTAADLAAAPIWINAGMEQLLVPLVSHDAVRCVAPTADLGAFQNSSGKVSVYCFSPLDTHATMLVRFFFAKNVGSVAEDPATGSACANLGGYALATDCALPLKCDLRQGEYTGRPCALGLEVDAERRIFVSGEVIELGRGYIDL